MSITNGNPNKRVAILIENAVEDAEFQVPYKALQLAGFEVVVLGSRMNENYVGKNGKLTIKPDATTTEAMASQFDAVVIPGGMAPDLMRTNPNTVRFVQEIMAQGKLVAAVCHGPQLLIEGDLLRDKRATGFFSIRKDMMNAGANYVNEPVVIDGNLITSRQPGDLPIFATAILNYLGYGGKEAALPDLADPSAEWWKLADAWGGSTKGDIVKALNTALAGERYSSEAFGSYAEKTSDSELKALLLDMIQNKQQHIQILESRLAELGEKPSIPAQVADKYAKLKAAITGSDDLFLLRSTLGDVQTGVVDVNNLRIKITDPVSTQILTNIEADMASYEQCLAALYKKRMFTAGEVFVPAKPSTSPAVKM